MSIIVLLITLFAAGQSVSSQACSGKIDLVFVIDGQPSACGTKSCPDWSHILQFIKNIVSGFNIGPDDMRVAVVTVSSQAKLEFNFDKNLDKTALLAAIDNVAYTGGQIDSIFSVTNILTSLVTAATSLRPGATVTTIGITDGIQTLHNSVTIAAATALQAIGMNVCMVCVTDGCPADFARSVSSPPRQIDKTYFVVDGYSSIDNARENLVKQICSFKGTSVLGGLISGVSSILF